ncbi:hypothetical protein PG995_005815 [Apiospora arundinis]
MSLFLSGVTWMDLSLLLSSSYQRLNPQLVHDHPTLQAMSSFNDIDEGPNLHEELPFWQEELSSSSSSSSSSEDGTKEYERSDGGSVGSDDEMLVAQGKEGAYRIIQQGEGPETGIQRKESYL